MTNGLSNKKEFTVTENKNITFIDITDPSNQVDVFANENGKFVCQDGKCSIFIKKEDYEWMKEELER